MELVAVDLGGTHARFALAAVEGGAVVALGEPVTLATAAHAGFEEAWAAFAATLGRPLPTAAAIALAAPVGAEEIVLTNCPWRIAPARIAGRLGLEPPFLLNDFAAVGHAVARAGLEHFAHLAGPDGPLPDEGTITVVGPGTGLGVAHLWRDGHGGYHVQATEGGHIAFAPHDAFEDALLARLRSRHTRVSAERVVAGPGLVAIHAELAAQEGADAGEPDQATLWAAGISGADPLAARAVDRFCRALGSVAGDLALAQGASGVVVAGGLGLRLREVLPRSQFAAGFRDKGRFGALLAALPVKQITHPQPGLFGAAAAFAQSRAG